MNTVLKFDIEGLPIPQGRPRAFKAGPFIRFYDPARSKSWKEEVLRQAIAEHGPYLRLLARQGIGLHAGPVGLDMVIRMPRPKSLSKKVESHIRKPDMTNVIKGVEDALEGWLYRNDSQICRMLVVKRYAMPEEKVGISMEVNLWEE